MRCGIKDGFDHDHASEASLGLYAGSFQNSTSVSYPPPRPDFSFPLTPLAKPGTRLSP